MTNHLLNPIPSERLLGPGYGPGVWPLRERLALSTALLDVDNKQASWNMISRRLLSFSRLDRPELWCSARSCAKQYALLLESDELCRHEKQALETEQQLQKQKFANDNLVPLSLTERIVRRLTAERVEELRSNIILGQRYYRYTYLIFLLFCTKLYLV